MTAAPMNGPITIGISTKNTIRRPWIAPTRSTGVWSRTEAFTVADTRMKPLIRTSPAAISGTRSRTTTISSSPTT